MIIVITRRPLTGLKQKRLTSTATIDPPFDTRKYRWWPFWLRSRREHLHSPIGKPILAHRTWSNRQLITDRSILKGHYVARTQRAHTEFSHSEIPLVAKHNSLESHLKINFQSKIKMERSAHKNTHSVCFGKRSCSVLWVGSWYARTDRNAWELIKIIKVRRHHSI